ncbi:MAG: ABC transporter permease subunit, partial [Halobacteriota archaeon]|nr:ABC transporter permease subunit [Halobacteriota archaeon]
RPFEDTRILVQIFIVFVGAFFPAVLNTVHGVKSIDTAYIESARTFGSSDLQILQKVIIPGSLPSIITGVRIGLGIGWMCVVAAEMIGGSASGIGFFIWAMYSIGGGTAKIISGMIAIGAVGYLMNDGILRVEKRVLKWL